MTKDNPVAAGVIPQDILYAAGMVVADITDDTRMTLMGDVEKMAEPIARAILAERNRAASPVQAGIDPLVARLGRIASERHTISHDEYGAKKALGVMAGMSDALDEAAALLRSQAERIAALEVERDDYKSDYLRRHKDAVDHMTRAIVAESLLAEAREALTSADEWMSCVEPHLRDGHTFKRDRAAIRATLSRLTAEQKESE